MLTFVPKVFLAKLRKLSDPRPSLSTEPRNRSRRKGPGLLTCRLQVAGCRQNGLRFRIGEALGSQFGRLSELDGQPFGRVGLQSPIGDAPLEYGLQTRQSLSLTVFAEMCLPVLGLISARR